MTIVEEMKMARFFAEIEYYVPFFYEDGIQDGYTICEDVRKIETDSVSEMAKKLCEMSDDMHSVCVWARNAKDGYGDIFYLDINDGRHYDAETWFNELCDAIARTMKYEKYFKELLIKY